MFVNASSQKIDLPYHSSKPVITDDSAIPTMAWKDTADPRRGDAGSFRVVLTILVYAMTQERPWTMLISFLYREGGQE